MQENHSEETLTMQYLYYLTSLVIVGFSFICLVDVICFQGQYMMSTVLATGGRVQLVLELQLYVIPVTCTNRILSSYLCESLQIILFSMLNLP